MGRKVVINEKSESDLADGALQLVSAIFQPKRRETLFTLLRAYDANECQEQYDELRQHIRDTAANVKQSDYAERELAALRSDAAIDGVCTILVFVSTVSEIGDDTIDHELGILRALCTHAVEARLPYMSGLEERTGRPLPKWLMYA